MGSSHSFRHVWLNNKDTFGSILFIKLYKDSDKCFGFRLELANGREFFCLSRTLWPSVFWGVQFFFIGVNLSFLQVYPWYFRVSVWPRAAESCIIKYVNLGSSPSLNMFHYIIRTHFVNIILLGSKALVRKIERIFIKSNRQNVFII